MEDGGAFDKLKMLLAMGILAGGLVAYYLFPEQSQLVRALGVVAAAVIALLVSPSWSRP